MATTPRRRRGAAFDAAVDLAIEQLYARLVARGQWPQVMRVHRLVVGAVDGAPVDVQYAVILGLASDALQVMAQCPVPSEPPRA
jgi:hypothetical protein